MTFRVPLRRRLGIARCRRERYANDPAYRLAQINAVRVRRGYEPYASIDDVGRSLSSYARRRQRGPDGRFV